MHLLENDQSIRSLPKPVRPQKSKILTTELLILAPDVNNLGHVGLFVKPKSREVNSRDHIPFRCSRIRGIKR